MKRQKEQFKKRIMIFAFALLGLIALTVAFIAPEFGLTFGAALATVPIWGSIKDNTFKELSVEEVSKLEIEEQIKYFNDLNQFKADQLEDFKKQLKKESSDDLEKQITDLKAEIAKDNLEQMKVFNQSLERHGLALNKLLKTGSKNTTRKTIEDTLKEHKDKLEKLSNKSLDGKIIFTIDKTEITTSSVTTPYQGMQIPGAGAMPHQGAVLRPLFRQANLAPGSNGTVYYTDQTTDTNSAAGTAESGAFKESVAAWTGRSVTIEKITDSFPVTYEALRDFDFMASEIRRLLDVHLTVKEDNYLWDGTGSTPIISGAYTTASAFSSAAYSGFKPESATLTDLIVIMKTEISNGYGGTYKPNAVVMNPADVLQIMLAKDESGQYIVPPSFVGVVPGLTIAGLAVVQSESVTANTLLVGDFNFGTIYDDGGVEIEMGYSGTDFTEDVVTVKARKRMVLLIRTMYKGAFLKSTDIATDVNNVTAGA